MSSDMRSVPDLKRTAPRTNARGYAYAKIEYVTVRKYLSKNRILV